MLTSLSPFQAQGWEKWLSRITFTRGTNSLKSNPKIYQDVHSSTVGSGYGLLSRLQILNGNKSVFFQQAKFWSQ
jgi:hypothetical protein